MRNPFILFIAVAFLGMAVYSMYTSKNIKSTTLTKTMYQIAEEAYFEGQMDMLKGNVCVEYQDTAYVWVRSPWDSGKEPSFHSEYQRKYILSKP